MELIQFWNEPTVHKVHIYNHVQVKGNVRDGFEILKSTFDWHYLAIDDDTLVTTLCELYDIPPEHAELNWLTDRCFELVSWDGFPFLDGEVQYVS